MLGKIDTPLDKKLSKVEWGEFKLSDIFTLQSYQKRFDANKVNILSSGKYPYIVRTAHNNGQRGFIEEDVTYLNDGNTISFGQDTATVFYQKQPYFTGDKIKVLKAKDKRFNRSNALFFTTAITKAFSTFAWGQSSFSEDVLKQQAIQLPIKGSNEIDFDFINSFIAELEAERIKELEAYLKVTGFDNYELTKEEEDSLTIIEAKNVLWREFKMEELFEKISTIKLPYKAKELPEEATDNFVLPCLTSSFKNQGLNYYAPKIGATILKNVISIPSNSDVYRAYFQSNEFTVLSDAYAIRWKDKSMHISQNQYLFMVMCINKFTDLPIYSYKNKLGGWNVVKNKYVLLPVKKDKIDFDFMETFINAIKKITLKDVAEYADKRIAATKEVIQNKKENSTETINNNSTSNDENYNKKGI